MANTKDRHYWTQLRSTLTGGRWTSPSPATAPNGTPLKWSDLLRKFNKHCRGYSDVAEVALQTRRLALLLGADQKDEDEDGLCEDGALGVGRECVLTEERLEEAGHGYEILRKLESPNSNTLNFARAYYAYALGLPAECLSHLVKVPDLTDLQSHVPISTTIRSNGPALQVPVPGSGIDASSLSLGSSASESSVAIAEIKDGRAWAMTETFRSIYLLGMAHERLSPREPTKALKAYASALPLLKIAETEIAAFLPPNSGPPHASGPCKLDFSSFTRFRELWRWVERLTWRAVILAARSSSLHAQEGPDDSVWTWLAHYSSCSAYWPATFRTRHRSTISVLHLRAFIIRAGSLPTHDPWKPALWLHGARTVIHEYRAILNVSTQFPRAGDRNVKVEEFVDLCVAVWEASGAVGDYAGWVIDILWWATRLTFNSYRVLRHMTRLFYVSGDTELAKRTLRLYVQIVGKAYQAEGAGAGVDADTDRSWVETLIQGARMLCRVAGAKIGLDGIKEMKEAGSLIEKAKSKLDESNEELVATVDLAEGIWSSLMALKEQDPRTRPARLSYSHSLFLRSVQRSPTPSGHYHLALSFARAGPSQDLDQAIINVASALEGGRGEIRYWHLLGLLLAALEKWKAAKDALEEGLEIAEEYSSGDEVDPTQNGIRIKDFGAMNGYTEGLSRRDSGGSLKSIRLLLDEDATEVAPAATLLRPVLDQPPPSRQDIFEQSLQLRMTQVVLAECVEGPEGASDRWVEVFGWIAEKRGVIAEQRRLSLDGAGMKTPSELVLNPQPVSENGEPPVTSSHSIEGRGFGPSSTNELIIPIAINILPATPDVPQRRASADNPMDLTLLSGQDEKPSSSTDRDRDMSKGKRVQQMLKNRVHKGQSTISTFSKKIGHGVVRNGSLRRSISTPDFHSVLRNTHYQASSIHSRKRLSSFIRHQNDKSPRTSPPPPPPQSPLPPVEQVEKRSGRTEKENKLLSDLWLMSAATFRRLGKIEQAKAAIQEAEVRDEGNPGVWVQLGLYYTALGHKHLAIDTFQKALFISPDDVSACVQLCRVYLTPPSTSGSNKESDTKIKRDHIDLAAGMLSHCTQSTGWDVPEAWYFLAKAYGMQGRKEKERECLSYALGLSERRGVRDIGAAVGWCT